MSQDFRAIINIRYLTALKLKNLVFHMVAFQLKSHNIKTYSQFSVMLVDCTA